MKSTLTFNSKSLDPECRAYLQRIWQTYGVGHPGVFMPDQKIWKSVLGLVVGLVFLVKVVYGLQPDSLFVSLPWQSALAAIGVACLWFSLETLRGYYGARSIGEFTYFDGTWLWEVETHCVRVTALANMVDLKATDLLRNGVRTHTLVTISLADGQRKSLTITSLDLAQQLLFFLHICQDIHQRVATGQTSPNVAHFISTPGGLARLTRTLLDSGGAQTRLDYSTIIPIPDPSGWVPRRFAFRRLIYKATTALGVLLVGWLIFPPLRYAINHNHHYAMIKRSPSTDIQWPQAYLAEFPQGSHRTEVTALLDDRLFGMAQKSAKEQHSPAAMRGYLAGQPNHRHQDEARQTVDLFYDEAIARVREMVAGQTTDKNLLSGLLAMLEYLKGQSTPVVRVAFQPSWIERPNTDLLKQTEKRYEAAIALHDPVINSMVKNTGTAIIGTQETFSDRQVRRRESVILRRLSAAVAAILSGDIITFQTVPPSQAGDLTIRYEIKPLGILTRYVSTEENRIEKIPGFNTRPSTRDTLGLLREYTIQWHLTIQPGLAGIPYHYHLNSRSGTNLVYRPSANDPEWGAYAVLMYSAFYDFSNKILAGVGLPAPEAPTTFTFHEAVEK